MTTGQKRKADSAEDVAQKQPKKEENVTDREDKILAFMMTKLMQGVEKVSFRDCALGVGFMERTKTQRESWKALLDKGFIEPCADGVSVFTGDHSLTEMAKEHASTDEYKEYLKELNFVAETNEQHHARIKKKLMNDHGRRIFDLLLEHGSLTRKELAAILGINDRSHKFSYALQELKGQKDNKRGEKAKKLNKEREYVESDPSASKGKLRLTDRAFLNGQRPESNPSGQDKIEALIKEKESTMAIKSKKAKKETKTTANKSIASPKKVEDATSTNDHPEAAVEEAPLENV